MSPILTFEKNGRESVVVGLTEYRGQQYADIRVWFTDQTGELKPSQKGVSIKPEHLPDVIHALTDALEKLAVHGGNDE
jgi:hypothetical protein